MEKEKAEEGWKKGSGLENSVKGGEEPWRREKWSVAEKKRGLGAGKN